MRDTHPYFYRVNPTSESRNYAIIRLIKEFGWKRFGTILQNDKVFLLVINLNVNIVSGTQFPKI